MCKVKEYVLISNSSSSPHLCRERESKSDYAKDIDTDQSRSFALIKQFQEVKMWQHFVWMVVFCAILLPLTLLVRSSQSLVISSNKNGKEKSAVFLSPMFVLGPGSVVNKYYYNIDFPRGHVALKDFNAEVVDEMGNSVPLHETYLHHWLVGRYYTLKANESDLSEVIIVKNSGLCVGTTLAQYFGLGSETRRTTTYVPDPYGIEIGNPKEIPDGYKERWLLNIHAIDTRGVVDRLGCTECRCDLYNITRDVDGKPLDPNYAGGLKCCHDQAQCKVKEGVSSFVRRSLYLRYTVKWVDWEDAIVPVKIYILDVTDTAKKVNDSTSLDAAVGCKVEYEVEACGASGVASNRCIDSKKTSLVLPNGGYVIYGVGHQHTGGIGSTLYGEDGRTICSSIPTYGQGTEPGNETDYIVGMSTCYPQPGSIKISNGETLLMVSNYSSTQKHTGVMGLFYLLVAEQPVKSLISSQLSAHYEKLNVFKYALALVFVGIVVASVVGASVILLIYRGMKEKVGYQNL